MMTMKKTSVSTLPRLKTKDELLKSSPELMKLFGEDPEEAQNMQTFIPSKPAPRTNSAGMLKSKHHHSMETPRDFEEELTEEQLLRLELEKVKHEREMLMQSITSAKAQIGTAGGEAQDSDIKSLRRELELKKAKLNELNVETKRKEKVVSTLRDDNVDATRLTPAQLSEEMGYTQQLKDEMKRIDEDLTEAEAKNRLYYLLGERTRREHQGMDGRVRAAQQLKEDCMADHATLTTHMNDMRALREVAERDLAKMKRMLEETRCDWQKKLRERRREVRELKKRQQKQQERERKQREKQLDKDRQEKDAQLKSKAERDAYELRVAALAPKVEAMEASWNRISTISGAQNSEDVITYWEGLKAKEERMRQLVRLAEEREAAAKAEIANLLESRAMMFERTEGSRDSDGMSEEQAAQIAQSHKEMEVARAKFTALRSISISAEQGIKALLERLMIALEEVPPDSFKNAHLRGMAVEKKHHAAGGRGASPARRHAPTPDRKTRGGSASVRAASPASLTNAGGSMLLTNPSGEPQLSAPTTPNAAPGLGGLDVSASIPEVTVTYGDAASPVGGAANHIEDEAFFPEMPEMLSGLMDRLNKVQQFVESKPPPASALEPAPEEDEGLSDSERRLAKGMSRRTMCGPPLLDHIKTKTDVAAILAPTMKRKKGKKKDAQVQPAMERILGYAASDAGSEEPSSEEDPEDEENKEDGVIDREHIKLRAMKMSARHNATQRKS